VLQCYLRAELSPQDLWSWPERGSTPMAYHHHLAKWLARAPGMVSEVSATLVATTMRRWPGGGGANTRACCAAGSIAYSGRTYTGRGSASAAPAKGMPCRDTEGPLETAFNAYAEQGRRGSGMGPAAALQGTPAYRLRLQARLRCGKLLGREAAAAQQPRLLLLIPVLKEFLVVDLRYQCRCVCVSGLSYDRSKSPTTQCSLSVDLPASAAMSTSLQILHSTTLSYDTDTEQVLADKRRRRIEGGVAVSERYIPQ
jgi:hypothetical protein